MKKLFSLSLVMFTLLNSNYATASEEQVAFSNFIQSGGLKNSEKRISEDIGKKVTLTLKSPYLPKNEPGVLMNQEMPIGISGENLECIDINRITLSSFAQTTLNRSRANAAGNMFIMLSAMQKIILDGCDYYDASDLVRIDPKSAEIAKKYGLKF